MDLPVIPRWRPPVSLADLARVPRQVIERERLHAQADADYRRQVLARRMGLDVTDARQVREFLHSDR